jgi:hypothetical protein
MWKNISQCRWEKQNFNNRENAKERKKGQKS